MLRTADAKELCFLQSEHHQKIIALLESQKPAGIVTATEENQNRWGRYIPFR